SAHTARARERGEFTDFVLICGAERFPVHKVIVCSQSKYEIAEQSPAIVRRMVEYFYTGDYKDCNESTQDPNQEKPECSDEEGLTALCIHARMFALADMYHVDRLQSLAVTKYSKAMEKTPNIGDLLDSISDVYRLTPPSVRTLRDKVIVAFRVQLGWTRRLRQTSFFPDLEPSADESGGATDTLMAAYDEVATESPEFLKDLLSSYIRSPLQGQCHNCGPEQLQPMEALQMKCLTCGKGGARPAYL
ncbi:hypothetical protein BT67DRAFT_379345, partial [Trichocladium antarcticum]